MGAISWPVLEARVELMLAKRSCEVTKPRLRREAEMGMGAAICGGMVLVLDVCSWLAVANMASGVVCVCVCMTDEEREE